VVFDVDLDTRRGWRLESEDKQGVGEFSTEGNGDFTALAITAASSPASLESTPLLFQVEPGVEYRLKGVARGAYLSEKSNCLIRLQFYSSSVPILPRGKAFLEQELSPYLAWGKAQGVPLYMGEFGTVRESFLPGRGGEIWVRDMLSLSEEQGLNYSYRAYHDERFGLFGNARALPNDSSLNASLWEVLSHSRSEAGEEGGAAQAQVTAED
jgi:endoglucanase